MSLLWPFAIAILIAEAAVWLALRRLAWPRRTWPRRSALAVAPVLVLFVDMAGATNEPVKISKCIDFRM